MTELETGGHVSLRSEAGIRIRQAPAAPATRVLESSVTHVTAELVRASGDTLTLRKMKVMSDETLDTMWRNDLEAFVLLSETPGVVFETPRLHVGRTAVFAVLAPVVAVVLYVALHMATFSPDAP